LSVHCTPVTVVSSRHLRSANQHQLIVPRCRRITFGRRAFSVAGPTVWNSLPTEFRSLSVSFGDFRRTLKTILFARYYFSALSAIEMRCIILCYINFLFYSILFYQCFIYYAVSTSCYKPTASEAAQTDTVARRDYTRRLARDQNQLWI